MTTVQKLRLGDNKFILVEMEEAELPKLTKAEVADLPEGAELTSAWERVQEGMQLLRDTIKEISIAIQESIRKSGPDEWTMEMNIGFKGKSNPVPIILSGESNVALKLTAKWKKLDRNP